MLFAVERCLERAALRAERARLVEESRDFARIALVSQKSLDLLANPDLEWLQEQVLAELTSLTDAQSAALWLDDDQGALQLKAYRGLLDRQFLQERLDTQGVLRSRLDARMPWLTGAKPRPMLHVPLVCGGELIGLAQLSDPLAGEFAPEAAPRAKLLADFAAVGVKNGRRFLALQRLGLRDRETAAYNLSYFTDYASKEIYKARRYGRTFSLLVYSIDRLAQVRSRLGAAEARRGTRGIIRALSKIVRDSDVIAKATEQEFYLLLPETDYFGALRFLRRGQAAVADDPDVREVEGKLSLGLVAGAATYPRDGEDFDELVHRCRRRIDERRASLQSALHLDALPFWDEVELLLGVSHSPKLPTDERAEPSRRGKVADVLLDEVQAEVARALADDPSSRGLVYVGCPALRSRMPIAVGLESVPADFAFRVYALGKRVDLDSHPALTPVFLGSDERIARSEFLLWLSETAAYALIQRRGRGATWGFHTSDTAVVEGLINKLQSEYDLQPY